MFAFVHASPRAAAHAANSGSDSLLATPLPARSNRALRCGPRQHCRRSSCPRPRSIKLRVQRLPANCFRHGRERVALQRTLRNVKRGPGQGCSPSAQDPGLPGARPARTPQGRLRTRRPVSTLLPHTCGHALAGRSLSVLPARHAARDDGHRLPLGRSRGAQQQRASQEPWQLRQPYHRLRREARTHCCLHLHIASHDPLTWVPE